MSRQVEQYIYGLYKGVPIYVYEGAIYLFCLGFIIIVSIYGIKQGFRKISALLLGEYLFLVLCSAVFFRITTDVHKYNIIPFWSYTIDGIEWKKVLIAEVILNIIIFLPVGFLCGIVFRNIKVNHVLLGIICLSSTIEITQFVFKKGCLEFDDVIHNTLGCLIGYGVYVLARYGYERICRRSLGTLVET